MFNIQMMDKTQQKIAVKLITDCLYVGIRRSTIDFVVAPKYDLIGQNSRKRPQVIEPGDFLLDILKNIRKQANERTYDTAFEWSLSDEEMDPE